MRARLTVAEDHPAMREMIVETLQRDFDVVASVETGLEAIAVTNRLNPDVLVIDVRMRGSDAREIVTQLKDNGNKTKVVFLTASLDIAQMRSCLAAGADAYVSKMDMAYDLPLAVRKVLIGETFVSAAYKF